MLTEADCISLPHQNAEKCLCRYEDSRGRPRILVVNSCQLYSLRTGLGVARDLYTLEALPTAAVPGGAVLKACHIVPGYEREPSRDYPQEGSRRAPSLVCLLMQARTTPHQGGVDEIPDGGDGAGCSSSRCRVSHSMRGLLNVYRMKRASSVNKAVRGRPHQISLSFDPISVCHTVVWRNPPPCVALDAEHERQERGDLLLVLGHDGRVRGFTRWDTERGTNSGSTGTAMLTEESSEALQVLIPDLSRLNSPITSMAAQTAINGMDVEGTQLLFGQSNGQVFFVCPDAPRNSRNRLNESIAEVAYGARAPRLSPSLTCEDKAVIGLACTRLGMISICTYSRVDTTVRWCTKATEQRGGDSVLCAASTHLGGLGSMSVALGTSLGELRIHQIEDEAGSQTLNQNEENCADSDVLYDEEDTIFGLRCCNSPDRNRCDGTAVRGRNSSNCRPSVGVEADQRVGALWVKHLAHPVHGLAVGDWNHDGADELLVATRYGVHIFRPDYRHQAARLGDAVDILQSLQHEESRPVAAGDDHTRLGELDILVTLVASNPLT